MLDAGGKVIPFSVKIRLGSPSDKDFVLLWPGDLVGKEISIERLIRYYNLYPGSYTLNAIYRNKFAGLGGTFDEILRSEPATLHIDE